MSTKKAVGDWLKCEDGTWCRPPSGGGPVTYVAPSDIANLCLAEFGIDPRKETAVAEPTRIELESGAYVVQSPYANGILRIHRSAQDERFKLMSAVEYNLIAPPDKRWPVDREWEMDVVSFSVHDDVTDLRCVAGETGKVNFEGFQHCDDYKLHTVTVTAPDLATARRRAIAKVMSEEVER